MPRACGQINQEAPDCEGELAGYEIQGVYDGVLYWVCSRGHVFARDFGDWQRLTALSKRYVAEHLRMRTEEPAEAAR